MSLAHELAYLTSTVHVDPHLSKCIGTEAFVQIHVSEIVGYVNVSVQCG